MIEDMTITKHLRKDVAYLRKENQKLSVLVAKLNDRIRQAIAENRALKLRIKELGDEYGNPE